MQEINVLPMCRTRTLSRNEKRLGSRAAHHDSETSPTGSSLSLPVHVAWTSRTRTCIRGRIEGDETRNAVVVAVKWRTQTRRVVCTKKPEKASGDLSGRPGLILKRHRIGSEIRRWMDENYRRRWTWTRRVMRNEWDGFLGNLKGNLPFHLVISSIKLRSRERQTR